MTPGARLADVWTLSARGGDGRYRAWIGEEWKCAFVPHGRVVASVAARAIANELPDPAQRLRSLNAVFAGQVRPGDASAAIEPWDTEVGLVAYATQTMSFSFPIG